jgi:nicotinamidase-related amidase
MAAVAPGSFVGSSTPYPWPWDGDLTGTGTAAVIVVPRGGRPKIEPAFAAAAQAVVAAVRARGGLGVLVTTEAPGRLGGQSAEGPPWAAMDLVDVTIEAHGIDGFCDSWLEGLLRTRGIARMILVGAGLETCIHSTMRSANDRGFECLLAIDASAPYDTQLVASAVSMIEMSGGIFGAVAASGDIIHALTYSAGA